MVIWNGVHSRNRRTEFVIVVIAACAERALQCNSVYRYTDIYCNFCIIIVDFETAQYRILERWICK